MKIDNQRVSESLTENSSDPEFIAQQLRRPSGKLADKVGKKMNRVNAPLYTLMYDVMKVENNDHILEIGFGTGYFFKDLLSLNNRVYVWGVDHASAMVDIARKENLDAISLGKLKLKQANSDKSPFPDACFDTVFFNMVIYFWDEPIKHLMEIKRVLKPGGKIYTGFRSRKSMLAFPFVEHGFNLYTVDEWTEILKNAGFTDIKSHQRLDPEIEIDTGKIQLLSYCTEGMNSLN